MEPEIRRAGPEDADTVWAMLKPVFRAGDTYLIDPDISRKAALAYWKTLKSDEDYEGDAQILAPLA